MASIKSQLTINDGMSAPLKNINRALTMVLASFESVQRASGKAIDVQSINEARNLLSTAEVQINQMEQSFRDCERAQADCTEQQTRLNSQISAGESRANGFMNKLKGAAAAYLSMRTAGEAVKLSDELTSAEARLSIIVGDNGSVDELKKKIYDFAIDARAAYTDTLSAVAKLGLVAEDAFSDSLGNINTDELVRFVNLVNKNFVVGGASSTEQASAMYQLTQSLASGLLQGDEYRVISDSAPLLAKSIEDYMRNVRGMSESMKEWASEGALTADVIKQAVFMSADEVEARFASMPKTWGQVMTNMRGRAAAALDPLLTKINDLANSPLIQEFSQNFTTALSAVGYGLTEIINLAEGVATFFQSNWGTIGPVIYGIAAALAFYNGVLIAHRGILAASSVIKGIQTVLEYRRAKSVLATAAAVGVNTKAVIEKAKADTVAAGAATAKAAASELAAKGLTAEQVATAGATVAQGSFNTALLACPITWIIAGIILLIAVIYAVIGAINKAQGTTVSATGVILGALATAGAFILNLVIGVGNAVIQLMWTSFVEPFIGIIEWVLNAANGGFDGFGGMVANLVGNIISWFLSLGKIVTQIIDAIFGTDWTAGLTSLQDSVLQWGKNENAITLSREAPTLNHRFDYGGAWEAGKRLGEGIDEKVGGIIEKFKVLGEPDSGPDNPAFSGALDDISATADNTERMADEMSVSDENLRILREIAERQAINNFTTAELKVDFTANANINSDMDIDGFVNVFEDKLKSRLISTAEGVHA